MNSYVRSVAAQSDGKVLIGGDFTTVNGTARGCIARLNSDGTLDTSFDNGLAGANSSVRSVAAQSDGKVLIGGEFTTVNGTARGYIARLNSDGTLDAGFGNGLAGATFPGVYSVAAQSDGKVLIGGWFSTINGTARGYIARLNSDGSLDTGNGLVGVNSYVRSVAAQSDGKVLIGGDFFTVNGTARRYITRLNSDGSLDTGFGNGLPGANNSVYSVGVQNDGKVLIGGWFSTVNNTTRWRIARLNGDGTLDTGFGNGLAGANNSVYSIGVQNDGKALIGGNFTNVNGTTRGRIARLNSDGSLDTGFGNGLSGASSYVSSVAAQSDGKVLIGGNFTNVNGTARGRIARLNSDGSLDTGFGNGLAGANSNVLSVAVQSDGKVLIGGDFTTVNGTARGRIARLNADGTLDTGFGNGLAGADGSVSSVAVQSDGKVLVGGAFTNVNGVARGRIARLNSDGILDTGFGNGLSGADGDVYSVAMQSDGKVLIGGRFGTVNGTVRPYFARLEGSSVTALAVAPTHLMASCIEGQNASNQSFEVWNAGGETLTYGISDNAGWLACSPTNGTSTGEHDGITVSYSAASLTPGVHAATITVTGAPPAAASPQTVAVTLTVTTGGVAQVKLVVASVYGGAVPSVGTNMHPSGSSVTCLVTNSPVLNGATQYVCKGWTGTGSVPSNPNGGTNTGPITLSADSSITWQWVTNLSPLLAVTPASRDFGSVLVNTTNDLAFTVQNTGGGSLTGNVGGVSGPFSIVGGTNYVLSGGATTNVTVRFAPTVASTYSNNVAFNSNGGNLLRPVTGTATNLPSGVVQFATNAYSVAENGGAVTVSVVRVGGSFGNVSATFATSNGVATAGSDYRATNGTLSWVSGDTASKTVVVAILDDTEYESNETFIVTLSGASLGNPTSTVVTIADDDPAISVTPTSRDFGAVQVGGTTDLTFTVQNVGTGTLAGAASVGAPFSVVSGSNYSLTAGQTTNVTVRYSPQAAGSDSNNVSFTGGGEARRPVTGSAIAAALSSLTLDVGTLTPSFSPVTLAYVASVSNAVASVTVTPSAGADLTIEVRVNGGAYSPVASGTPSGALVLNVGANTIDVRVTAPDSSTCTYNITVTRQPPLTIVTQPASLAVTKGGQAVFSVYAIGSGTLTYQWKKDNAPIGEATNAALVINPVQYGDAGNYTVDVTDSDGSTPSSVAGLSVNSPVAGDLDFGFFTNTTVNGTVYSVAVQSDGKVLIGGFFSTVNGTVRGSIARLNSDGSTDYTFGNGLAGASYVFSVAVQSDGKVLIGGNFSTVNGTVRGYIARLNSDGSTDHTFGNGLAGANNGVRSVALQSDGKVLIGGIFSGVNGTARGRIARLNSDGTLDSGFGNGLTGANSDVLSVAVQNDGKVLIGGNFTTVNGTARGHIARLNADGALDTAFGNGLAGADNSIYSVAVQSDGKVLIGGDFTRVNGTGRWGVSRLNTNGTLDAGFGNGLAGVRWSVYSVAVQSDGKVLIGGDFTEVNRTARSYVARLNNDGTLDAGFGNGLAGPNNAVRSVVVQSNGKVLIGGHFTTVNDAARSYVARLDGDCTLDTGFGNGVAGASLTYSAADVRSVAVQSDGKVLIGGYFTTVSGTARGHMARLNSDGTLDSGFGNGLTGANYGVNAIAVQSDGKVLIGGRFDTVNGLARGGIARLDSDGALDDGFGNGLAGVSNAAITPEVYSVAVQIDGKVLIGGEFSGVNGTARGHIARLNSDGTLDAGFGNGLAGANSNVYSVAVQSDGKVVLGGDFTTVNGMARGSIARLNSDGTLDTGFGNGLAGARWSVSSVAVQSDGKVLIGGAFTNVNGTARGRIARLNSDGSLDTSFGNGLAGADSDVRSVAVQSDGKVLIGGDFDEVNGTARGSIARLNSDGTLDTGFGNGLAGARWSVSSVVVQSDGKVLIGGLFTMVNGVPRACFARLEGPSATALAVAPTHLTASCLEGQNASNQSFEVWNAGGGTLTYGISDNADWLTCSPTNGTNTGEHDAIAVSYTTAALTAGMYAATITVTGAPPTIGSPATILVQLTVTSGVPELVVMGTNGTVVASGSAVSSTNGTEFSPTLIGAAWSNVFSIGNNGRWPLIIGGVTTNGAGAAAFQVSGFPIQVSAGSVSNFTMIFQPTVAGVQTAVVEIANNSATTSYRLCLAGTGLKHDQTIDFPNPGAQVTTNRVGLSAMASSGLLVTFEVASGPGVLAGTVLSFTNAGQVSIVASQAGDTNWNPAASVTNVFLVSKVTAMVTLQNLAQEYDGTLRVVTATTEPPGLTVVVTYDGSAVAPTNAGSYAVTGTVNDAMYEGWTNGTLVVSLRRTLTVSSTYGGASPGTVTVDSGTLVAQWVTNSPVVNAATQYVCAGAVVMGNDYTLVSPTNVTLTLTNDATLSWQWTTQYWFAATAGWGGRIAGSSNGWCNLGGSVTVTAMPAAGYYFAGWSGDVPEVQTNNNPLTLTMDQGRSVTARFAAIPPPVVTIWPTNTVPGVADDGPDSAVELGVKFKSDVAGTITGIRFYKAPANTNVHVGNLWASNGTWLATVMFSNETASGWQQVLFATPVAIASNTVYVASYHANNGHYSQDPNYFQGKGMDNPPLHALADGVSGGNGVYAYGASSAFPNQTWNAANYWVDVVFQARPAPTLMSIAVTPTNSNVFISATQQFTATGTYSDGSTQNLTTQVTWTSSNTSMATINATGLARGVSAGTTTISAALGSVSNSTMLTVKAPPILTSITVTPVNPNIWKGASLQFTATGTYLDGSTNNLSSQVAWTSSNTGVATINTSGLAIGVATGTTTISAMLTNIVGFTTLTVQPPPLSITTTSLPPGIVNTVYLTTLAASGGTLPYTWLLASGSLPSGLTLTSNGAITGTPTAGGTSSFTVQVRDANSQTTNKVLSLTIASAPTIVTIWPSNAAPGNVDEGADNPVELGVKFKSDVAGSIVGIRFYKALANTNVHIGNLWTSNGTWLATATFTNETASGWQQVFFATPVTIASNTVYVASYHANNGHYSADANYFSGKGMDNPPLHALTNSTSSGNGVYAYGASSAFPNQTWNAANYWVDVVFEVKAPPPLIVITVTPANSNIVIGATQQFTATVNYSDGSAHDITSQATWTSSNTAVATINTSGLATGVATGTTTISAALGGVSNSTTLTVLAPPTLMSITVKPMNTNIWVGASLQFTATGTYLDGSTNNLSSQVMWTSSNSGVVTINTSGLATGIATGTTTISAALGGVSNSTTLTVQALPTLTSIAVTPANPNIWKGASLQFTATGAYLDGSTNNLSSQVAWTSSNTGVATINTSGLATGVSTGTTTISAMLTNIVGFTTLTVQPPPLSITTTSLSPGIVNTVYSTTLAASGGTLPYTWSLASGSLPSGLTLTSNGAITGTPTAGGTSSFTVQVRDANSQTTNKVLSLTIASAPTIVTIWPSNAVPGSVDGGPDSTVELGVKFKSDVAGTITGIRFYKATANTNTHIGNLWTSNGIWLATVTFSNETTSGWQQALFATPVAIVSNTVYLASYHANNGHYSQDLNYFQGKGMDNPPLHALADGVSGGNGVYAYGPSSAFPNQTYNAANYWVDVVFRAGPAPTLMSIVVTPANSNIVVGATQQFTAMGTYSDGSTQNLSSRVTWTSLNTGVATINATGLATGVSAGTTIISAALGSVSNNTTLTVQSAPLVIATTSLPAGVMNVAYSATLTATGGTAPYTWSMISGTLPSGLTLTSSGVITGTPTTMGAFGFTAQVSDVGSPGQTTNKALDMTITSVPTVATIWPSTAAPGVVDEGPDSAVELGVQFKSDVAGTITGIRFYKAEANTGSHTGNLWSITGTRLARVTFSNETASGWQQALFATPVTITSNTVYVASYHANNGHYSCDLNYFTGKGMDNPPLHALANGVSGGNGVYAYGASSAFPNQTWNAANYWVDVVFQPASPPPPLMSVPLMAEGATVERWPWVWTSGDFFEEYGASNLIDSDTNTMWIGNVGGEPWRVILDLGVVTDVTDIQLMFLDTAWTNQEIIGSRDSEVWFDYLAETNEWVPLRYLYVNFWGDEHGAQPPAIREIIWRER